MSKMIKTAKEEMKEAKTVKGFIAAQEREWAEEAKIVPPKMEMDEIIQKSDIFETIRVIMEILCEKLKISKESQPKEIFEALRRVSEEYYKAMEEFGNLRKEASKNGQKDDIRQ